MVAGWMRLLGAWSVRWQALWALLLRSCSGSFRYFGPVGRCLARHLITRMAAALDRTRFGGHPA